jgi:NAD(P)H-dependent FMN reductase
MKYSLLIVPGSLRSNSTSYKLIREAARHLPADFDHLIFEDSGSLPHFNDIGTVPEPVVMWRKLIAESDGVLFITPEYAFGVPGTLKNTLDWIVSSGELVNKPTALITASTGGHYAHQSLLLTLGALSADVKKGCSLLISFIRSKINDEGEMTDLMTGESIRSLVETFTAQIKNSKNGH